MYSSHMVHSSDSLVQTVMAKAVQVEKNRAHGPTRHRLGKGASTSKCTKRVYRKWPLGRWPMSTFFVCISYPRIVLSSKNSMNKRQLRLNLYVYLLCYLGKQEKNSLLVAATLGITQAPTNPCIELMMDRATTTDI